MRSKTWIALSLAALFSCSDRASRNGVVQVRSSALDLAKGHQYCDWDGDDKCDFATWRPSSKQWAVILSSTGAVVTRILGLPGDIPVPGDYDGDRKTDYATWDPSTGNWNLDESKRGLQPPLQWGSPEDIPVPGDYNQDGLTDRATFRPSNGQWAMRTGSGDLVKFFGGPGDIPVPGDYDGDQRTDMAVWVPSTQTWKIKASGPTAIADVKLGIAEDIPVPMDFDGDNKTDRAVFRPSTATWVIVPSTTGVAVSKAISATSGSDIPVPRDFDGDGKADLSVWTPVTGMWRVQQSLSATIKTQQWGMPEDIPAGQRRLSAARTDVDGDRKADGAAWDAATGTWNIVLSSASGTTQVLGGAGDVPFLADIDGDGKADRVINRPRSSTWTFAPTASSPGPAPWGAAGMIPLLADFDGDRLADLTVFNAADLDWAYRSSAGNGNIPMFSIGNHDVIPLAADFDGDGKADRATWAPKDGMWNVNKSLSGLAVSTQQWGQDGDIPVPADYDGDRQADYAIWRPSLGMWAIIRSSNGTRITPTLGVAGDTPIPDDYDGDGKADLAVRSGSKIVYFPSGSTGQREMQLINTFDLAVARSTVITPIYAPNATLTSVATPTVAVGEFFTNKQPNLVEYAASVVPAGSSNCPQGRRFSTGCGPDPGRGGRDGRMWFSAPLNCTDWTCTPEIIQSISTDVTDDDFDADNVATRLSDGTLLHVQRLTRHTSPVRRVVMGIFALSPTAPCNSPSSWTYRSFIDPSDNVRFPPPEKATDPKANYGGPYDGPDTIGGWDRDEIYADPFSSSIFIGVSGRGTGTYDTLLLRSTDAGLSWSGFPFAESAVTPVNMTSFPGRLLMFTCSGEAPLLWWSDDNGQTVKGGNRISWRYPCKKWSDSGARSRGIDGSTLIGRSQWNQDKSGTVRIFYPTIRNDGRPMLVQYSVALSASGVMTPTFVRTISPAGRDAWGAALVEPDIMQAGMSASTKALLYWKETDATTTRMRGMMLEGVLGSSAQFDVSTVNPTGGGSRSWNDVRDDADYMKGTSFYDTGSRQARYFVQWAENDNANTANAGLKIKIYGAAP